MSDSQHLTPNNVTPTMVLSDTDANVMEVPEFPARNGPQRLVAAATPQPKRRQKVKLEPGHSPLDWARLKSSGKNLRGVTELKRYTLDEVREHRTQDDAWTVLNGKVYNMSAYVNFHPGGVKDVMRIAGRDGTKLFMMTHSWVNYEFMLDACLVGFLTAE
ncbi:hypothetical protein INT43_007735 [Umbelopsis isabellina]|uniref:Cytochrome b5 heme-binding domain-containing protein n=1 Tax=Mortierella isabellina TaxID=91625 RepID=A0A8H7PPA8_MORIS|nr:hypothetical protein INT43_007735 [Umbelopsis isabellina]